MPHVLAGPTIEPDVSVPMPNATHPPPVAEPGPADEPPDALRRVPRILRLAAEPVGALRELPRRELGDQHGAGVAESNDDFGVVVDHAILEIGGAPRGRRALDGEEILHAPRHAVQRATILPGLELGVHPRGVGEPLLFA